MKTLLFIGILLPSLTALSQPGTGTKDSTVTYPIWVMWRYEHDAQRAEECGKLIELMKKEINAGLDVEVALRVENSSLKNEVELSLEAGENLAGENRAMNELFKNQKKLIAAERKKKNKWKVLALIFAIGLIIK